MIKKYSDLDINVSTLEIALKTINSGASFNKKVNSPKYLIIDWSGAPVETLDFSTLGKDIIYEYFLDDITYINNPDILLSCFKHIETKNEEFLWNRLVDSGIINDILYQKQTYQENFDTLIKMTGFRI